MNEFELSKFVRDARLWQSLFLLYAVFIVDLQTSTLTNLTGLQHQGNEQKYYNFANQAAFVVGFFAAGANVVYRFSDPMSMILKLLDFQFAIFVILFFLKALLLAEICTLLSQFILGCTLICVWLCCQTWWNKFSIVGIALISANIRNGPYTYHQWFFGNVFNQTFMYTFITLLLLNLPSIILSFLINRKWIQFYHPPISQSTVNLPTVSVSSLNQTQSADSTEADVQSAPQVSIGLTTPSSIDPPQPTFSYKPFSFGILLALMVTTKWAEQLTRIYISTQCLFLLTHNKILLSQLITFANLAIWFNYIGPVLISIVVLLPRHPPISLMGSALFIALCGTLQFLNSVEKSYNLLIPFNAAYSLLDVISLGSMFYNQSLQQKSYGLKQIYIIASAQMAASVLFQVLLEIEILGDDLFSPALFIVCIVINLLMFSFCWLYRNSDN